MRFRTSKCARRVCTYCRFFHATNRSHWNYFFSNVFLREGKCGFQVISKKKLVFTFHANLDDPSVELNHGGVCRTCALEMMKRSWHVMSTCIERISHKINRRLLWARSTSIRPHLRSSLWGVLPSTSPHLARGKALFTWPLCRVADLLTRSKDMLMAIILTVGKPKKPYVV